jgi:hypothetical protein
MRVISMAVSGCSLALLLAVGCKQRSYSNDQQNSQTASLFGPGFYPKNAEGTVFVGATASTSFGLGLFLEGPSPNCAVKYYSGKWRIWAKLDKEEGYPGGFQSPLSTRTEEGKAAAARYVNILEVAKNNPAEAAKQLAAINGAQKEFVKKIIETTLPLPETEEVILDPDEPRKDHYTKCPVYAYTVLTSIQNPAHCRIVDTRDADATTGKCR